MPVPGLNVATPLVHALFNPHTPKHDTTPPMSPCNKPSSMNGIRMNQFVAPTSFITSISRRRANIAVRMVFQIRPMATASNTSDMMRVTLRTKLESVEMTSNSSSASATASTPGRVRY